MTILDNIQTLPEIQKGLDQIDLEVLEFSGQFSEKTYFAPFGEKWSMAGNLEHLILTNAAMAKTFSYPKEALIARFGKAERPSFSGAEIIEKYLTALEKTKIKAPPAYSPQPDTPQFKTALFKMWIDVESTFQNNLKKWSDKDLDVCRIPHPAMGNLNLRELALFAIYHTSHHLKAMKKIAAANV
jgi:hypothetical protein